MFDQKKYKVKSFLFSLLWLWVFQGMLAAQQIRILDESLMSDNFLLRKNESIKDKIPGNIFVRLELDKKKCFVGAPVVATFKLYTRLKSESKIAKRPSFSGFSVYDMISPDVSESGTELYKGKQFNVYVLRKVQLYALQSGRFTIEPMEVENEVSFMKLMNSDQNLSVDDLLGRSGAISHGEYSLIRETVNTASESAVITVDPLPEPIPKDFNGYTGSFKMNVKIIEDSIHVNDLVHLKILISGKGNFPIMNPPIIEWGNDFDAFEPEVIEKFDLSVCPITGAKIYSYPFVPKKPGNIRLPAIVIRYFDPQKKLFILDSSNSRMINILPAKEELQRQSEGKSVISTGWKPVFILVMLLFTVFLVFYFYGGASKRHIPVKANVPEQTGPVLYIEENITLDKLEKLMERGDAKAFYKFAVDAIDQQLMLKYGKVWPIDKNILADMKIQQKDRLLALVMMKERFEGFLYSPLLGEPDLSADYQMISNLLID